MPDKKSEKPPEIEIETPEDLPGEYLMGALVNAHRIHFSIRLVKGKAMYFIETTAVPRQVYLDALATAAADTVTEEMLEAFEAEEAASEMIAS